MASNSETNDLIEQERLASSYEPTFEDDLVSSKKSTKLLEAKYENGDPMFQSHLTYLESRFPFYRSMRGDGSCGWRACLFGYYELLVSLDSTDKFQSEKARLKETSSVIPYDQDIWEDWFDEAAQLLDKLATGSEEDNRKTLREAFNNNDTSMMLMSYLRALTTGWMISNSDDYAPWIEDGLTVSQYCDKNVNPVQAELENLSLKALYDVLLKPAGFAIDVYYLDRSVRDKVEPISFTPEDTVEGKLPTVNLLYQIGHYDMFYETE